MTAAASAASSRAVQDTGPSAGTAMTPVSRHGPGEPVQAVRVEAVAQRRPGDAGLGQQLLGREVVAPRAERGVGRGALVAGVEDAPDARR